MTIGLIGRKCGMTRVFTEAGETLPVTVILVEPNRVTQLKTTANDGYQAVQVTTGSVKPSRINKPDAGQYAKNKIEPGRGLWEFTVDSLDAYSIGAELTVELFSTGQFVDVTATSKGKGFAGSVKRHNFRTQDATHGNSRSHRVLGSTGQIKVRKWRDIWVLCVAQFKLKRSFKLIKNVTCYSCVAPFLVHLVEMSLFALLSKQKC
jgi:large subunit ribosomal protein L3